VELVGVLEGSTLERSSAFPTGELTAFFSGARVGGNVTFTKVYDNAADLGLLPIAYAGTADSALDRVQGHWRLIKPEPLRGGFIMRRVSASLVFTLTVARDVNAGAGSPDIAARMAAIRARRRRR
jgi:hypothetical protein